ncbi:MAG: hypothetical protein LBG80_00110 [Bacteroidales bacterium]|jgi:hypothetical protein|nr:hypothetical protein [Bacteroidales bacterium]
MKSIRKQNLFTTTVVMLFFFSIIGFWGCEKESIFESQYTEYLDLETYEMSKMSVKDMETMGQALQRLNIYKKKGLYQIKQTSGAQVNISEDLFDYITKGFEHTNVVYNPKSFNSFIPRLKSGNTEDSNTQPRDSTHCASYALAAMGGVDYATAAAYSDSTYGAGGVPADSMVSFFRNFYPNGSSVNPDSLSGGFMGSNMIYFQTSDSTGHAVNGTYYDTNSGNIMYSDPQTGGTGIININDVIGVFKP